MNLTRYTPEELLEKCRQIRRMCATSEFMRSPGHQKTQEMWCAAQYGRAFASAIGTCWLRVSDVDEQNLEDFWLEYAGECHPFQISLVADPDRRMGDEYRNVNGDEPVATHEDWTKGSESGPCWVADRVAAKATKYGPNAAALNLLLYLNFAAWQQDYERLCLASQAPASKFRSVWLLNGNAFCCIKGSDHLPWLPCWYPAADALEG
jgi:hypothetical protein